MATSSRSGATRSRSRARSRATSPQRQAALARAGQGRRHERDDLRRRPILFGRSSGMEPELDAGGAGHDLRGDGPRDDASLGAWGRRSSSPRCDGGSRSRAVRRSRCHGPGLAQIRGSEIQKAIRPERPHRSYDSGRMTGGDPCSHREDGSSWRRPAPPKTKGLAMRPEGFESSSVHAGLRGLVHHRCTYAERGA